MSSFFPFLTSTPRKRSTSTDSVTADSSAIDVDRFVAFRLEISCFSLRILFYSRVLCCLVHCVVRTLSIILHFSLIQSFPTSESVLSHTIRPFPTKRRKEALISTCLFRYFIKKYEYNLSILFLAAVGCA